MRISWIDIKLGIRMLVKYPVLSLVAVVGMALAIAIGAGYFAVFSAMLDSTLPIEKGERAIVVRNRAVSGPEPETPSAPRRRTSFSGAAS
jgi:hypothetical protein